jgi:hypothetical protein
MERAGMQSSDVESMAEGGPNPTDQVGQIRVRSNVVMEGRTSWDLVPGEVVKEWNPYHRLSERQRQERMYYVPCCLCGRNAFQIDRDGCITPCQKSKYLSHPKQ